MGFIGRVMSGLSGAWSGFVEGYFDGDASRGKAADDGTGQGYGDWSARQMRYALYWSMYRNNTYRDIKKFAKAYKGQYGLYRYTRGVYSPSKRLADFYRTNLYGGSLDYEAGDGKEIETSIPIDTDNPRVREALGKLWWDSGWEVKKGTYSLWGTVLGDVAIRPVEDVALGVMRLEVVHPGTVSYLQRDDAGDVLAYQIREKRPDPKGGKPDPRTGTPKATRTVEYVEEASLEGGRVIWRTYCDGRPFDWSIDPATGLPFGEGGPRTAWILEADWVPFYWVQHIDEGLGYGVSELEGGRAKIDEVNDLGSKLHDQVRRMVEGAFLFSGVPDPKLVPPQQAARTRATAANPEPGRQELKIIYADKDAKAQSLVGSLDVADTSAEIRQTLDSLEDDYPELRFERLRIAGTISGETLRVARQPAAARVQERRPSYDYPLMCAQMAAMAIGGARGFEGYEGFSLDSYSASKPNHRIARRPVFAVEPMDTIAEKTARFAALKTAVSAGFPLEIAMADLGYSRKDVTEVKRLNDEAAAKVAKAQDQAAGKAPAGNES